MARSSNTKGEGTQVYSSLHRLIWTECSQVQALETVPKNEILLQGENFFSAPIWMEKKCHRLSDTGKDP